MLVPFRPLARLIVAVLCTSLAVPLMGASTPSLYSTPTLVIFPFRFAEGLDPNSGAQYVSKLGSALTALGGVKVVMADPATVTAEYLHVTKADNGDYYLIGYVAPPVNNVVSVIEQLVSARSGTVVWSDTAHVSASGGDDILNQGPVVKAAVMEHTNRGYLAITAPTPKPKAAAPTPSPAPQKKTANATASGPGIPGTDRPPLNLPNEAYGFSSKPTAAPKLYAAASRPARFVVLTISGPTVTPALRDYAASSLIGALKSHGQTVAQGDPATTEHPIFRGPDICTQTGAGYLVFGSLTGNVVSPRESNNYVGSADAYLNLIAYNCGAKRLEQTAKLHGWSGIFTNAVDKAANTAVTNYLLKVATASKTS
jgi:hypothetical protein